MDNKEYRIDFKLRNNLILKFIEFKGYKTVGEFCRLNNLQATIIGNLVNLKQSPLNKKGDFTETVKKLATCLEVIPEQLFSEEQLYAEMENNKRSIELSHAEAMYMIEKGCEESYTLEDLREKDEIETLSEKALSTLTPKESTILKLLYGLDGNKEHMISEVAEIYDISYSRAHQIRHKALRKLRNSSRSYLLKEFVEAQ